LDPEGNRGAVITELLKLVEEDPVRALELTSTLPKDYGSWVAVELHRMCVEGDPEGAANWLTEFKPKQNVELRLASSILGILLQQDPAKAFQAISGMSDSEKTNLLRSGAISIWGQNDPAATLREAEKFLSGDNLEEARMFIAVAATYADPELGLSIAKKVTGPTRDSTLLNVYAAIGQTQGYTGVLIAMKDAEPALLQKALGKNGLIQKVAKNDPDAAITVLSRLVFSSSNSKLSEGATKQMASTSPEKTWEWIEAFPKSEDRAKLEAAAIEGLATSDPGSALKVIAEQSWLDRPSALDGLGKGLGQAATTSGFPEAAKQLNASDQAAFLESYSRSLTNTNSLAAVELLTKNTPDSLYADSAGLSSALGRAAASASKTDFDAVAASIETTPEARQPALVEGLVRGLASTDPLKASEWLSAYPDGEARNSGIKALVKEIETTDPEAAAKWSELIR
jgi:hypothetical protein